MSCFRCKARQSLPTLIHWDLIGCCGPLIHEHLLLTDGKNVWYFYFKSEDDMEFAIKDLQPTHWAFLGSIKVHYTRLPVLPCDQWVKDLSLLEKKRMHGVNVSFIKTGKQIKSSKRKGHGEIY